MLSRGIIGIAIAVYLAVLGCVMIPSQAPAKKLSTESSPSAEEGAARVTLSGLPYRGAGMQIQRVDWIDKYKKNIDEIADLGLDTVSLVIDTRQENAWSTRIYLDMRMTPTPEQLADLIGHAKSRKLRVILMPIVLLDNPIGNQWRGVIAPSPEAGGKGGWDEWFDSYREMLKHFAWVAEQNHVDVLSVGSELVSAENKTSQWKRTIDDVRGIFHGQLTYSANWDHYTSIPFWDQLDLIGMNSYYKLGENRDVTVDQIVDRWHEIQTDLLKFQAKVKKPLLFLEIGWCSLENAAHEPWDYTQTGLERDDELQRKLYEGYFKAWYGHPALGGFIVWEWTPGDGGKTTRDATSSDDEYDHAIKGYTPENKPAQDVIKQWIAKPWKQ